MLIRTAIAIVGALIAIILLAPVTRLIGFPVTSDLFQVYRVLVAAIAVLYILKGAPQ